MNGRLRFGRALLAVLVATLLLQNWPATADDRLVDLSAKVSPSVVHLLTDIGTTGSGFVAGSDILVTNFHVIDGCKSITVKFQGGAFAVVSGVLFANKEKDIAVLRVETRAELMVALPICRELPKQGEDVAAFGNPKALEFSVTRGIVSAVRSAEAINEIVRGKFDGTWIQTDAAISPGNSGGPLVNRRGEVVGINTMSHVAGQNLNFAISCVDLRDAIRVSKDAKVRTLGESPKSAPDSDDVVVEVQKLLMEHIQSKISRLTHKQLSELKSGDLRSAYSPTPAADALPKTITRIKGTSTLVQIAEGSILMLVDGVTCRIDLPEGLGGEFIARYGNKSGEQAPIDGVFFVGPATPYKTARGTTHYYVPLHPVTSRIVTELPGLSEVVEKELASRAKERQREVDIKAAEEEAVRQRVINSKISAVRNRFRDESGNFEVDAVVVGITQSDVTMIRMDNKKELIVPISRLNAVGRQWLKERDFFIKKYSDEVRDAVGKP